MICLPEQNILKDMRLKNLSDIFQVLRKSGPCSLAQLTEKTDGRLTTVKKCFMQAREFGMVMDGETAECTGGRQ